MSKRVFLVGVVSCAAVTAAMALSQKGAITATESLNGVNLNVIVKEQVLVPTPIPIFFRISAMSTATYDIFDAKGNLIQTVVSKSDQTVDFRPQKSVGSNSLGAVTLQAPPPPPTSLDHIAKLRRATFTGIVVLDPVTGDVVRLHDESTKV